MISLGDEHNQILIIFFFQFSSCKAASKSLSLQV